MIFEYECYKYFDVINYNGLEFIQVVRENSRMQIYVKIIKLLIIVLSRLAFGRNSPLVYATQLEVYFVS